MYQVGDRFNNMRHGSYITVIDKVADRVYGLGDVPFIRHKYFLKGKTSGKTIWVTDDDIEGWLERGVLSIREERIEPIKHLRPLTFSTTM
jgi:hypothetical protein